MRLMTRSERSERVVAALAVDIMDIVDFRGLVLAVTRFTMRFGR